MDENADAGTVTAVATENANSVTVDDDRFEVEGGNLKLKAGQSLDFESDTSPISVTITASGDGESATATVSVSINDVNEAPEITVAEAAVDENAAGAAIAAVTVSDDADDTHTFTVDDDRFEVVDGMLKLKDGMSLDHESGDSVMVNVTVTDAGDLSASTDVMVMVNDVNEAPEITVAEAAVDENVMGATLGAITFSDPDAGQTHTLSTNDARFETKQDAEGNWWLALADGESLDYEDAAEVVVTVTVTDDGDPEMSASTDVTITVNDGNEAPSAPVVRNAATLNVDENAEGAQVSSLADSVDPEGDAITYHVDDDRFEITDGLVLKLKDGMSLDHETADSVTLTITAMDDAETPATSLPTMVTVAVNDVPEGPVVAEGQSVPDLTPVAGQAIDEVMVDLVALFSDPEGDLPLKYVLDGPDWLSMTRLLGEDENGAVTITGILAGTPPLGTVYDEPLMVSIVATDPGGNSGNATFQVLVDDGNDVPTAINLANMDGTPNIYYKVEVDENDASGVVLGSLTVDDIDDVRHPHGQHAFTVDDDRFEVRMDGDGVLVLALKDGESLDYEFDGGGSGSMGVVVTATDINGAATGLEKTQTITVVINDQNDAPTAHPIGNWWVTVDEDLEAEDVTAGQWLSFALETAGDDNPAFEDVDDGDELTYSLVGPAWLEIDSETGAITNKEGMLPESAGIHDVTVTATDPGMESASVTFKLAWAISDAGNEDNDQPNIDVTDEIDYPEGSAAGSRFKVGTFTVTDDDIGISPHPYGELVVEITSATDPNAAGSDYLGSFELSDPVKNGDTWTYHVYVKEGDVALNHEVGEDIVIVVAAFNDLNGNGVSDAGEGDEEDIRFDVDDVQEAPEYQSTSADAVAISALSVEQSAVSTTVLYLNLFSLWEDPDGKDSDDELDFAATSDFSWITILHGPDEWGGIKLGVDPDDASDDLTWGGVGTPADDDMVVIIEIDRTGANNDQVAEGSFTLTATDESNNMETEEVTVSVTDENLTIGADAVSITGVARESSYLWASFDADKDPDLAGGASPVLVLYTWTEVNVDVNGVETDGSVLQASTSNDPFLLTQAHVGDKVKASVEYYEMNPDGTIADKVTGGSATTMTVVDNTQDAGMAHFNLLTNATTLSAEVDLTDEDGVPLPGAAGAPSYTWEISDNGRGGWAVADAADDASDLLLTLPVNADGDPDGGGKYYRMVIEYTDNDGVAERIESHTIQLGKQEVPATPTISGSAAVGGTLIVAAGDGAVQWQQEIAPGQWVDIVGATGDFSVTSEYEGANLRGLVTYTDAAGVTAAVATSRSIIAVDPNVAPVQLKDQDFEAEVNDDGLTELSYNVDLAGMFQDADGDNLTYSVTSSLGSDVNPGGGYLYFQGGQLLAFDVATGAFSYDTDQNNGHDGVTTDGDGNVLTLVVTADDGNGGTVTADVNLRLNVAPTAIAESGGTRSFTENAVIAEADRLIADLDVMDENDTNHEFGTHAFEVDDARFEVVPNATDGSQGALMLKEGEGFDFETDGALLTLTITATDGGGKSVTTTIDITITNDPADDPSAPAPPDPVPGLKDDDTDTDDDDGLPPTPTPGGAGHIIDDFGTLGVMNEDLLESFVLAIDDGLELG